MKSFRSYQLARSLYRDIVSIELPRPLGDQLRRTAASCALTLTEGYGRTSIADQRRDTSRGSSALSLITGRVNT